MKTKQIGISLLWIALLAFLPGLKAQQIQGDLKIGDPEQIHRIATKRGDVFIGRITAIQNTEVQFLLNETIELKFALSDLETISVYDPDSPEKKTGTAKQEKEYLPGDQPFFGYQRGLYFPSGFLLRKGETEYRNAGIFFNNLDFGITDHFNLGVGGIPLILGNIFQFKLRAGAPLGDFVHLSANATGYLGLALFAELTTGASFTGAASIGTPDRHFTAGAGYGFGFEGDFNEGILVANLAGSYRFSPQWRGFAEVIFPVDGSPVLLTSLGANWFKNRNRIEFGLSAVSIDFTALPFPFIGYGLIW